ncbi:SH3 domain-containing protein [Campylobacter gastrosuis]|uniref:SH3 domain-containing protein n=1 Tax=Campylobacter gastrosuis TaxID=2974576 RepID=A0ABT7HMS3_9BACT|nr:SH3 domain-containing protein [Campylobacter gastrosuis]MDL0088212.1 SH3 domain-containing protein [Campylobacter gastrosuis]
MVKKLLLFLLAINLGATSLNEPSVFDMLERGKSDNLVDKSRLTPKKESIKADDIKNIMPTDEPDLSIPDSSLYDTIKKRDLILKVQNMPKNVVVGEIFKVEITANPQSELDFEFESTLDERNIKWVNSKFIQWVKSQNDTTYTATLYLQAKNSTTKSVNFTLNLKHNRTEYQKSSINIFLPKIKELKAPNNYNNIVANSLEVKKFKTTKFDDLSNIMIVEISGKNVDLASFFINDRTLIKQGVDTINGDFGSQSAYYFAVFKPNKRSLDFSYYNLQKEKFESFSLPVSVEDDEISTHVGLNPKQSDIATYKNVTIYSLAILLFVLGIFRRKISYFIAVGLLVALGIYTYNPFRKATLKQDVSVKILPTTNSTIFYISKTKEGIEILNERNEYVKILFNDGKIGWVKKDDIIKN